jgi:hypothetical protein
VLLVVLVRTVLVVLLVVVVLFNTLNATLISILHLLA